MTHEEPENPVGRVAELFAGVGGFRLGLSAGGWQTVFSNQWEPSTKRQHASEVYLHNFGFEGHTTQDIATVEGISQSFDLLVGGFPCQDYSVAKSKSSATGLEGRKGVLWWEILRLVNLHKPKYLILENVDRLLKSPTDQRGRDFAVMLTTLGLEGYFVEWRVINAADYGFPQRRRRVFIVAYKTETVNLEDTAVSSGVLANAFEIGTIISSSNGLIPEDVVTTSETFGLNTKFSPFRSAGVYVGGKYFTLDLRPPDLPEKRNLADVLLASSEVSDEYTVEQDSISRWEYLKGSKSEERTHTSGFRWKYTEGPMLFPDPLDRPSRTLLTGEGGPSPSRFKHVVLQDGRLRRLHPIELERLNGFPDNWTANGTMGPMTSNKRAFFMGNALVVGLVQKIGQALANRLR